MQRRREAAGWAAVARYKWSEAGRTSYFVWHVHKSSPRRDWGSLSFPIGGQLAGTHTQSPVRGWASEAAATCWWGQPGEQAEKEWNKSTFEHVFTIESLKDNAAIDSSRLSCGYGFRASR